MRSCMFSPFRPALFEHTQKIFFSRTTHTPTQRKPGDWERNEQEMNDKRILKDFACFGEHHHNQRLQSNE